MTRPAALSRTERVLAEIGIVTAIGCALGLFGVLLPTDMALGARLLISIAGFVAAWVLVRSFAIVGRAMTNLLAVHPMWSYAFAIPLSGVVISLAVLWWLGGADAAMGDGFAAVWPGTIAIGIAFFALFFVLYWRAERVAASRAAEGDSSALDRDPGGIEAPPWGVADTALHKRLPPGFPAILALSVEDHYVRAHGEGRTAMVLMTLTEAIALMPENTGNQVHRSWWVARNAVRGHRRAGRDIRLILTDDTQVPVSRTMVQTLREAGWL